MVGPAKLLCAATLCGFGAAQVYFKPNPLPENYIEWTATVYEADEGVTTYSASTEDEVVFWWESGTQDVWELYDATAYKNCDFSYATQLTQPVTSGGDYIEASLDLQALSPGTHYLTTGVGAHCEAGQKLVVTTYQDPLANEASGWNAFVGAGASNKATGDWSTIGGGYKNKAAGQSSVVMGGISNAVISNYATITGGYNNYAGSRFATVLGGAQNTAKGRFTVAAGYKASTSDDYSAAFGFSGEECTVTTAKTVSFCAESFYLNDVNILDSATRRLNVGSQRETLTELAETINNNQAHIDDLMPAVQLQKEAFSALERIESRLAGASA